MSILPEGNQKMLAEKHTEEILAIALLIVGPDLIACYFCWSKDNRHINDDVWGRNQCLNFCRN